MKAQVVLVLAGLGFAPQGFAADNLESRDACLLQLKAKIQQGSIRLTSGQGETLKQPLLEFRALSPKPEPQNLLSTEYDVSFPQNSPHPKGLLQRTSFGQGDNRRYLEIKISQERAPSFLFALSVFEEVMLRGPQNPKSLKIAQEFDVTTDCALSLQKTTIEKSQLLERRLTSSLQDFLGDIPKPSSAAREKSIDLPTDGDLLFALDLSQHTTMKQIIESHLGQHAYLSLPSVPEGIAPMIINRVVKPVRSQMSGQQLSMTGYEVSILYKGSSIQVSGLKSSNPAAEVMLNEQGQTWVVDRATWNRQSIMRLSHAGEIPIKYAKDQDPSANIVQVVVDSSSPLLNANLKTYWKPIAANVEQTDGSVKFYRSLLESQDPIQYLQLTTLAPLIPGAPVPYLGSSDKIQVELPAVQALAAEVKVQAQGSQNRAILGVAIGEVLRRHLTYNFAALEAGENVVEEKTEEILKKQVGTCQNFSNVFVAVARALGIPARIIVGLNLGEGYAGYHAWTEIQTTETQWIPYEPQSPFNQFKPANYFPLTIEQTDTYLDPRVMTVLQMGVGLQVTKTQPEQ